MNCVLRGTVVHAAAAGIEVAVSESAAIPTAIRIVVEVVEAEVAIEGRQVVAFRVVVSTSEAIIAPAPAASSEAVEGVAAGVPVALEICREIR